jgi:hypothetical protein
MTRMLATGLDHVKLALSRLIERLKITKRRNSFSELGFGRPFNASFGWWMGDSSSFSRTSKPYSVRSTYFSCPENAEARQS